MVREASRGSNSKHYEEENQTYESMQMACGVSVAGVVYPRSRET